MIYSIEDCNQIDRQWAWPGEKTSWNSIETKANLKANIYLIFLTTQCKNANQNTMFPLKAMARLPSLLLQYNCTLTLSFLGGLSLHLNHLIAWHVGISFWQFGTLPIGIFFVKFGLKTSYDIS